MQNPLLDLKHFFKGIKNLHNRFMLVKPNTKIKINIFVACLIIISLVCDILVILSILFPTEKPFYAIFTSIIKAVSIYLHLFSQATIDDLFIKDKEDE